MNNVRAREISNPPEACWAFKFVFFRPGACSCFTEDSSSEASAQGAWSDIAIRARATTVVPSAVMYKAESVLTRGRAINADARIYLQGDSASATYIGRYVESDACRSQTAHLVAGWKQTATALAEIAIDAYMGHRPWWWPASAGGSTAYLALPNSVSGTAAIAFWRDVCASRCAREFDDEVQAIEVDLRRGLHDGSDVNADPSSPATCKCFGIGIASHVSPGDINLINFLSTAALVNNYVGSGALDGGVAYRKYVNTYAVHRMPWESHFVDVLQSSVYYAKAFTNGYLPNPTVVSASGTVYHRAENILDVRLCIEECTRDETNRLGMQFAWHHEDEDWCECSTTNWLLPTHDVHLIHDPSNLKLSTYRLKYCGGVAGGSDRSVVYNKADGSVCPGMPVGSGMILPNGSMLIARDAGDFSEPFDLQCKARCDANPDCAVAHAVRH